MTCGTDVEIIAINTGPYTRIYSNYIRFLEAEGWVHADWYFCGNIGKYHFVFIIYCSSVLEPEPSESRFFFFEIEWLYTAKIKRNTNTNTNHISEFFSCKIKGFIRNAVQEKLYWKRFSFESMNSTEEVRKRRTKSLLTVDNKNLCSFKK